MRLERLLLLSFLTLALPACEGDLLAGEPEGVALPAAPPTVAATSDRVTDTFPAAGGTLSVLPIEHASFILGWQGKAIYVDPSGRSLADATLPRADAVLVTDPHYDHLDSQWIARLRGPQTVVVGPAAAAERAPMDVVLANGETREVLGIQVTAVPSYNLARGPVEGLRYHDKGRDNGYLLEFGGLRVYVSGDTECTPEIEALGHVDVAFVSLNEPYAMTPPEASRCLGAFRPAVAIPYAYRHADLSTLDLATIGPGVELRKRDFYVPNEQLRQQAYKVFSHGMWGWADDLLDLAKIRDPKGDDDWRVQMTRRALKEYEHQFPFGI